MADELETWVQALCTKTYPGLTLSARRDIYRGSDILQAGYAALRDATQAGDGAEVKAMARRVYLAWVQVLASHAEASRMAQETRSVEEGSPDPQEKRMAPVPSSDPYERYEHARVAYLMLVEQRTLAEEVTADAPE